jgi:hypothetical protein
LPVGSYLASVWRDNQRETSKIAINDGIAKISLSPKGITAIVIEGINVRSSFQDKFQGTPASERVITQKRIETPLGDVHATILSFGPELTWLYAYCAAERGAIKSAKMRLKLSDREEVLSDDEFPFEFSFPLKPTETLAKLDLEVIDASDKLHQATEATFGKNVSR